MLRLVLVLLMPAAGLGGWLGYLQVSGNFHSVVAGELYRSAQPGATDLRLAVGSYGIRSVINLRGANSGAGWYREEIAASAALGVQHFDFPMSADRALTLRQAAKLIALMRQAPKPLLIHCQGGADRSGLAAALYLAAIEGRSEAESEAQISLRYGHLSTPLAAAWPMDRTFETLEPWLGFSDS